VVWLEPLCALVMDSGLNHSHEKLIHTHKVVREASSQPIRFLLQAARCKSKALKHW
jgi:hypothetical protein